MKKMKFLSVLIMVMMIGFFTSCEKDEAVGPSIDLTGGNYISSDVTVDAGADLEFKWNATKGDAKLATFTVYVNGNIDPDWNKVEIENSESDAYSDEDVFTAPATSGEYVYKFEVTDKDGMTASVSVTITVVARTLKAEITNVKIFCTLGDGTGSSTCASADGITYVPKYIDAADQPNVDFVYFYTASAAIYSPSDVATNSDFPANVKSVFSAWSHINTTYIGAVVGVDYNSATITDVVSATESITTTSVKGLKVNDIIGFVTESGKAGIFKVMEIKAGYTAADYIVISIKVEE